MIALDACGRCVVGADQRRRNPTQGGRRAATRERRRRGWPDGTGGCGAAVGDGRAWRAEAGGPRGGEAAAAEHTTLGRASVRRELPAPRHAAAPAWQAGRPSSLRQGPPRQPERPGARQSEPRAPHRAFCVAAPRRLRKQQVRTFLTVRVFTRPIARRRRAQRWERERERAGAQMGTNGMPLTRHCAPCRRVRRRPRLEALPVAAAHKAARRPPSAHAKDEGNPDRSIARSPAASRVADAEGSGGVGRITAGSIANCNPRTRGSHHATTARTRQAPPPPRAARRAAHQAASTPPSRTAASAGRAYGQGQPCRTPLPWRRPAGRATRRSCRTCSAPGATAAWPRSPSA